MNFTKSWLALAATAAITFVAGSSWAGVSADEAKQLGTTLTPIGAEKAGNKDGTIPAWTGGMTTLPPRPFASPPHSLGMARRSTGSIRFKPCQKPSMLA